MSGSGVKYIIPLGSNARISATVDERFVVACLALFRAGFDTAEIARRMVQRESDVATAVRIGREAARLVE